MVVATLACADVSGDGDFRRGRRYMRITRMLTGDAAKRKLRRFKYQVGQQRAWGLGFGQTAALEQQGGAIIHPGVLSFWCAAGLELVCCICCSSVAVW